jgi:deoxyribose-phosphate aldolase
MELNKYIDHTKLGATSSKAEIDKLIKEAIEYKFCSVCVDPIWVSYAAKEIGDANVQVCTVVGFPSGAHTIESKKFEARDAILNGATEIDYVINVSKVKEHDWPYIIREASELRLTCKNQVLKVILETCYLTDEEIKRVCDIAISSKLDFVKTSTGFGKEGATREVVRLMCSCVKGSSVLVKASGGIRDYATAKLMYDLGASRLGTSKSVDIVTNQETGDNNGY